MRIGHIITLILIIVFFFDTCKKKEEYIAPVIEILSPTVNSTYNLPGKMFVEMSVNSERDIKFIRASIDNSDLSPIFGTSFFYPEVKNTQLAFSLDMNIIPITSTPPNYLHIAVDDGVKLSHEYLEIVLKSAPLHYKGFNLITYSDATQIFLYDSINIEKKSITINGNYKDAETSIKDQMVFLATSVPGKLYAFKQDQLEVKWVQEPEMPFPYYTDIVDDGVYLFVGFGNERIAAFDGFSGFQKIGTSILVDSVPEKIGIAESFFVGDFSRRNSQKRALVSFYRATGAVFQKMETDISVVDFYTTNKTDKLEIVGNRNGRGVFTGFNIVENRLDETILINEGQISSSCKTLNNTYLISIDNKIYEWSGNSSFIDHKLTLTDNVVDLQFEFENYKIFVATQSGIEIYGYPSFQQLDAISSDYPVKAVRLNYGY